MRRRLLVWYDRAHRDLPWRRTRDPYRIWVSEIMLQQTRVGAVLEHYAEFFRRFPNLNALAKANEAEVLAAWSGLGYYRRARSLHRAAKMVVEERGGVLPRSAEEWRMLPGVGRYTAAAIASIAFGEAQAVVDGNVERVLARVFARSDATTSETWQAAEALLDRRRPGDYNQAVMELGATVCLPGQPRCEECPWRRYCASEDAASRSARTSSPKPARRVLEARYVLAQRRGRVLLQQREAAASLMPGMWELPPANGNCAGLAERFRHAILDTNYRVEVYRAAAAPSPSADARWISQAELRTLPLTGLCRKVLRHFRML